MYVRIDWCMYMYLFGLTFARSLQQLEFAKESALLSKEKLCIGLSMFEMVLSKLRTFLDQDKEVWEKEEPAPKHSVMEVRYICKLRFCFHLHVIANSSFYGTFVPYFILFAFRWTKAETFTASGAPCSLSSVSRRARTSLVSSKMTVCVWCQTFSLPFSFLDIVPCLA